MHLGQPLVLNAQLDPPCRVHFDHIHKLPGNAVRTQLARDGLQRGARQEALEDSAKGSAQPHLDFRYAQQVSRASSQPLQVHIVDANHLAAVNIDDLPVHQVLLQVKVVALFFERRQSARGPQLQRAGRRLHHVL